MTDMEAPRTVGALIHDTGRECDGKPGTEVRRVQGVGGALRVRRDLLRGLFALPAPRRTGQRRPDAGCSTDVLWVVPFPSDRLRAPAADRRMSRADYDDPLYRELIPVRPSKFDPVAPMAESYGPPSWEALRELVDEVVPQEWRFSHPDEEVDEAVA